MHVQGSPWNLGAIGGDQDLLGSMALNVSNDNMLASTRLTTITDVRSPVTGPIANERHHRIDETRANDLTSLARCCHRIAFFIQQFTIPIRRPDMVIVALLTAGGEDDLLGLAVT